MKKTGQCPPFRNFEECRRFSEMVFFVHENYVPPEPERFNDERDHDATLRWDYDPDDDLRDGDCPPEVI